MDCRTWSLPTGDNFTGLCSMLMLAETENTSSTCELCVVPVAIEDPPVERVLSASCRTWKAVTALYSPLCANRFMPEEGLASCPLCVTPIEVTE